MRFVLVLLVCLIPLVGFGQSALPACAEQDIARWDDCQGEHNFNVGRYRGEWRKGKPHGQGEFSFKNGMRFVGSFKFGNRNGEGVTFFANGDRYEGAYRNGRKDGKGTLIRADGTVTEGYWLLGKYLGAQRTPDAAQTSSPSANRVPLIQGRGTFHVAATVNGQETLDFMVDSGASVVTVPAQTVQSLIASGALSDADFKGVKSFFLADGSKVKARTFVIRDLRVGDHIMHNVSASEFVGEGRPLLGQSFLRRFKSWSIDNTTHELVLQ